MLHGRLLGGADGVAVAGLQSVAAGMLLVCFVCYLSFVTAAGDFSGYQSDGMLLEAGFIAWFFALAGTAARLGRVLSAVARQPFSAAVGVVSYLLRVRSGKAGQ